MIFPAYAGTAQEKRPDFKALLARAFIFSVLYLLSAVVLRRPESSLGWLLAFLTKAGLGITAAANLLLWLALRSLTYRLDQTGIEICLGIRTIRIPYSRIHAVTEQNGSWEIRKGGLLVYAKEVPQLIEYIAQLGGFTVAGRCDLTLYSTLSSYHDPKGLILITTTDGKTYGLSPAEPERFLEELETRRRQAHPQ
jgi:hypothetical protein